MTTMRRFVVLAVMFAVGIVGACAARSPVPAASPGPVDASVTWAWQTEAGTTWYTPGRGWTWAMHDAPVQTRRSNMGPLFAATAAPSTFQYIPPTIDASYGLMVNGAGYISNVHCILTVAASDAGASLYIMGIDTSSSSQPTNGTVPIYGVVSGAMSSVGNDVTFSDTQTPATITFANGLMLALSSTADTFTAPSAGNQIRCDAKVRSS